ncbi:MAG: hypothetical protein EXR79_14035 [Myxococcales bacterium]|nr:hypothetical protein [Myxococcales bacterium]
MLHRAHGPRRLQPGLALLCVVGTWTCADALPSNGAGTLQPPGFDSSQMPVFDGGAADLAGARGTDTANSDAVTPTSADATGRSRGAAICEFPANPAPGQAGAVCVQNSECDSAFCLETAAGPRCAKMCTDCCPKGFACKVAPGGDVVTLCVAKGPRLCRPCTLDADCASAGVDVLCVGYGDEGRFCGGACEADGDCPVGAACQVSTGAAGGSAKQCVRKDGPCTCSPQATAAGASTPCGVTNAAGTCKGVRQCGANGLTACDAPQPATETCGGGDEDCDGAANEIGALGCIKLWPDADGDGSGKADAAPQCLCAAAPPYTATTATDCDDGDKAKNPAAPDLCNGVDDDCDGVPDDGAPNTDGDALADCVDPDQDGDGTPNDQDCKPFDKSVGPQSSEACNGLDDDCDGATDEPDATGCANWWPDADGDGFGKGAGAGGKAKCLCAPTDLYAAATAGDCDDGAKAVNPLSKEVCNDQDDNCSGSADEGCDDDGDDWCDAGLDVSGVVATCPKGKGDCADGDAAVHPGAAEVCGDGKDGNCDGKDDEPGAQGCGTFYVDADQDGFGTGAAACLCAPSGQQTAKTAGDCADLDPKVGPKQLEWCGNGKDDNCSGTEDDEDAADCTDFYADPDKDGFGVNAGACMCGPNTKYPAAKKGDCDPGDAKVFPGAKETCNGKDDDCDGKIDEEDGGGCSTFFADADGDGFGDALKSVCLCKPEFPFVVAVAGDCNDADVTVSPALKEACNGKDDNCSGAIDEPGAQGCKDAWTDTDGDGFGDPTKSACVCKVGAPFNAQKGGDCDDTLAQISPLAAEVCNGKDDNCAGGVDEANAQGCQTWLPDQDGDGYGKSGAGQCLCKPTAPWTAQSGGDCDDGKAGIHPKAAEVCDGDDNDCDGLSDNPGAEGCLPWFVDADQDGYGTFFAAPKCLCGPKAPYTAAAGGDCNDNNNKAYPKAPEVCDGVDTDCDGINDPKGASGCKLWYADGDNDGWGATNLAQCTCQAEAPFVASKGGDCNDGDGGVNPGAAEVNCNGKDDNCDGASPCSVPKPHPCDSFLVCNQTNAAPPPYKCYCDVLCKAYGDCCTQTGGQASSCVGSTCGVCK